MTKARILLSSDYTYGPPMTLAKKKEWIESEVKNARESFSGSGIDCEVLIPGMAMDVSGEYKFDADGWNNIAGYEFLLMMERRGFIARAEGDKFRPTDRYEEVDKIFHSNICADFRKFFPAPGAEFDASTMATSYEVANKERVSGTISCINDVDCSMVLNMGGGSSASYKLLPELLEYEGELHDNPTIFIGFSDGTTLPFYFMNSLSNVTLVQASGLYKEGYLVGESEKPIQLSLIDGVSLELPISAPLVPISVHTIDHQVNKLKCVKEDCLSGKVVALESTDDRGYKEKIKMMIDKGIFALCPALIFGEFGQAVLGDFWRAVEDAKKESEKESGIKIIADAMSITEGKRKEFCDFLYKKYDSLSTLEREDVISLMTILKESLFEEITSDLRAADCNMPIYREEPGQSAVFGHGCRRGAYISSSTCEITPDGVFTSSNPVSMVIDARAPSPSPAPEATLQLAAQRVAGAQI